ncbi:MAG: YdeI/OmpD-associated family protein [Gammaproteobacteria bacterium]
MSKKDPRVDAYIKAAPDFAQPILKHIRKLAHKADPDIEETVKWGMPTFTHDGIVCGMAAFKLHCALGFWKGKLILDGKGRRVDDAMGSFGRVASLKDLPSDAKLLGYIRKAVKLNQEGVKVPGQAKRKAAPLRVPPDLGKALKASAKAAATFKALSTSHRNEYVEWITAAKQQATREKRLSRALKWLAEGKNYNWRYEKRRPA